MEEIAELRKTVADVKESFEINIKAEKELEKSEKKYSKLFNKIADPIFIFDKDTHHFLDFNEAVLQVYGYSAHELKSMTLFDLYPPEDFEKLKNGNLGEKDVDIDFTYSHITKYGQRIFVEVLSDEIEYDGRPAWISIVRDITEMTKVREKLLKSQKNLRMRVNDRTNELIEINEQMEREINERKKTEDELKGSFEKLQKTLEGVVHAMAIVVEARDPYTAGHQRRVAELATAIAREMDLPDDQIEEIRIAGLLHDIGKISIPSEILSRPGKLSKTEFTFIKDHPQVGFDILKGIEFPWPIARIVLQHHERLDGSGYPGGLEKDEIMLEAKILGVADVVEAMSSHRPYRPALGIDKALGEVLENRGVRYAREVVDTCLKLFADNIFSFEEK